MQVVAAGANPVQITRGIDKTVKELVKELKKLSKEVFDDIIFSKRVSIYFPLSFRASALLLVEQQKILSGVLFVFLPILVGIS